jgi:hypothetical protein
MLPPPPPPQLTYEESGRLLADFAKAGKGSTEILKKPPFA